MDKKYKIILWICIGAVAICAAFFAYHFISKAAAANKDKTLEEQVRAETDVLNTSVSDVSNVTEESTAEEIAAEESTAEENPQAAESDADVLCPIDFSKLNAVNPELFAWLTVENTDIDYPVARHEGEYGAEATDYYYLYRGYDGSDSDSGTLFTTCEHSKDMNDNVTIIYGHNMSRFSELKNYRNESYWDSHRTMTVYTAQKELTYKVWAAVIWDDDFVPYEYDLDLADGFASFIEDVKNVSDDYSHVDSDMSVTEEDRLLILSTCLPENSSQRYLVIGVFQSEKLY